MPDWSIRTLGAAAVLVDGRSAPWRGHMPERLFHYLLTFPHGRGKERIIADLWDEDPHPRSLNRLRVGVYRVRAALGDPGAVREQHGRYALSERVLAASDAARLHDSLSLARTSATDEARLNALRAATTAYGGEYLPDEDAEWAQEARDTHRAAYVRALVLLSEALCARLECRESMQALARAARLDPLVGEAHQQRLIACLSVQRGPIEAIDHYRRFAGYLRHELHDTPAASTLALVEHVKREGPRPPYARCTPPSLDDLAEASVTLEGALN